MKRNEVLQEVPSSLQKTLEKTFSGVASPREAIKAMCAHCVGYERKEVTLCTNQGCPLWEYRPYQSQSGREGQKKSLETVSDAQRLNRSRSNFQGSETVEAVTGRTSRAEH